MKNGANVREHYDLLIAEENDPFRDPDSLRAYMDRWDGQPFLDALELTGNEVVLEIGVGTGRLAARVIPGCRQFWGIDLSPKTVARAGENLQPGDGVHLICGDFMEYALPRKFDVIYSSLTLMHIFDKAAFIGKVSEILENNGRFVLSLDKNQETCIDMGTRKVQIYPDDPAVIAEYIRAVGMTLTSSWETEAAWVLACRKD